jgi:prepilin-type N-terminal cleavage/methylation domain-containing protein
MAQAADSSLPCEMRRRHGFTLIELLIAVLVIGAIAAFVLPMTRGVRENAYVAAMKHTLDSYAAVQEVAFQDLNRYAYGMGGGTGPTRIVRCAPLPDGRRVMCWERAPDVSILAHTPNPLSDAQYYFAVQAFHLKTQAGCTLEQGRLGPSGRWLDGVIRCAPDGPPPYSWED